MLLFAPAQTVSGSERGPGEVLRKGNRFEKFPGRGIGRNFFPGKKKTRVGGRGLGKGGQGRPCGVWGSPTRLPVIRPTRSAISGGWGNPRRKRERNGPGVGETTFLPGKPPQEWR